MTPAELKDLFERYSKNQVTEAEKQLVDDWYASYTKSQLNPDDEQRLQADIRGIIKLELDRPTAKVRTIKFMRYAAAVAILLVSVSLFIRKKAPVLLNSVSGKERFTQIKTKTGEVKKISLPDGSSVWLNANSEIRISDDFQNRQQRSIYLDEGEAFFEVTKNSRRPFLVKTPHVTTRVLGTSFNIKAYQKLKRAIVTVRTGKVQVTNSKKLLAILTPSMQVTYNTVNDKKRIETVDGSVARAWTEGKLVFNKANFDDLAFAIANIYGIQLKSKNKAAAGYRYNIHINTSRTLEETLRVICSVHQNQYRRINNEVIIY